MLVRKGSGKEAKMKLDRYRRGRNNSITGELIMEQHYAEKVAREGKNKEALLFFVECLKEEFSPELIAIFTPVFDGWAKRRYAREATLAYHDVKNAIGHRDAILYKKLGRCQAKLKRYVNK